MIIESANKKTWFQEETVIDELCIPVSVLIEALYRQIITTGHKPFSLDLPTLSVRGQSVGRTVQRDDGNIICSGKVRR